MIFRRRRVRIELEESTLTLRLSAPSVASPPVVTNLPPAATALAQPKPDVVSRAANEPKFIPKGSRHV